MTKSFARIHVANLINAGIIPLTFENEADYDAISKDDLLAFDGIRDAIASGAQSFAVQNKTTGKSIPVALDFSTRQREILLAGGLLNYTKQQNAL